MVYWGAVALTGLMETSFPQRSGTWQVVKVLTPRSMPGEVKDQPDEWPDGRVFWSPSRRNRGRQGPATALLERELLCPHRHCSRRAAPLRTRDRSSLHHLAASGTEQDRVGGWIICQIIIGLGFICPVKGR